MGVLETQVALLGEAMEIEQKGCKFYTEAAQRAADPSTKDILLNLAKDEEYHEAVLIAQRNALKSVGTWAIEEAKKAAAESKKRPRPSIIPEDRKKAAAIKKATASDLEAIQVGIQTERASYAFYSKAADEVDVEAVKDLYRSLAAWERRHFDALQEMYDFLSDPESWYLKEEKPIIEG